MNQSKKIQARAGDAAHDAATERILEIEARVSELDAERRRLNREKLDLARRLEGVRRQQAG
jgi:hypothetical protein